MKTLLNITIPTSGYGPELLPYNLALTYSLIYRLLVSSPAALQHLKGIWRNTVNINTNLGNNPLNTV